ncbi:MAG: proline--tRNA ligase [Candidatus Bathyarchaeia archaeon]
MSKKGEITRSVWQRKFKQWFRDALIDAEIFDYRYPIKGFGAWLPYGFKLRENVTAILRRLLDESGHEEVLFPLLIPREMLEKESEHIAKFEEQVFWVTKGGRRRLGEEYALRPTSETAIAPMLKLWIRSHRDLPKIFYQVVNIFRYETKATVPLLRVREVMTFKEAHTAHATLREAERQVRIAIGVYRKFFDELGVPYLISKRPDWDKFPGAEYSIAFDFVCPNGQVLQIGTVHNLGQNFSRVFDISFETPRGDSEYVWQTCYGISGRGIASMIIAHGDDRGPVLPPNVAPTQIVIVPIPYRGYEKSEERVAKLIAKKLGNAGVRFIIDNRRRLTPGSKFYDWEIRGVPLRIEIGPRDVDEDRITIVRRDTLERSTVPLTDVASTADEIMREMVSDLSKRAWEWMRKRIVKTSSIERLRDLLTHGRVVETGWCGEESCGLSIEEQSNASILGTAIGKRARGKCLVCGREAHHVIRIARTF